MFRRSLISRQTGEYMGNTSRRAYEQNYRENLRRKAAFWDSQGRFTPISAVKYVLDQFGLVTKLTLGGILILIIYSRVVNWTSRYYQNRFDGLMQAREDYLVSTGKLKHPKYMVNPTRQIDDPDANNIPCYTIHEDDVDGKKVFSRSFFDEYYEDDLHADKSKFQRSATIGMNAGKKHTVTPEMEEYLKKRNEIPVLGAELPPGMISGEKNEEETLKK